MSTWRALNDKDPMPFGKYQGTPMIDVPASYLLYLKKNGLKNGSVLQYILLKEKYLKEEVEEENIKTAIHPDSTPARTN